MEEWNKTDWQYPSCALCLGHRQEAAALNGQGDQGMNNSVELQTIQEQLTVALTQLQRVEAVLRERDRQLENERQRYQALFNFSPEGYLVTNAEGMIQEANQAILDQLSIPRDLLVGQPFFRFVASPDATQFYAQWDNLQAQTQGQTQKITLKPYQGEPFSAQVTFAFKYSPAQILETRLVWQVRKIGDTQGKEAERQNAEASLQGSPQRYPAIFEEPHGLLSSWTPEKTLLSVNDAYCQFYGKTREELLGRNFLEVIPESVREDLRLALDRIIHTLSPDNPMTTSEEWSVDATGQPHYFLWSNRGIFDGEGRLVKIQSMGHEITDHKRIVEALKASEAHNRALISAVPDLVMLIDREGTYLDFLANTNFKVMGKTGDFIGTTVYENLPPELAQRRIEAIHAALETGSIQCYEQDFEIGGQTQTEEVRVVPYQENEALLLLRDISDRKRVEKALEESEARFQQLANASPGVIYTILEYPDQSIACEYLSPAFEEIHEIPISEARRNPGLMPAQIHPDDLASYQQAAAQSYAAKQFRHEWRIITPSGKIKWIGSHSRAEFREDGVIAWHGIIQEITDRKQAERTLQNLIAGTAAVTGQDFFPALSRHIAEALDVRYALVTELVKGELQVLAFWANGALQPSFSYRPTHSPCEQTLRQGQFYCENALQQKFSSGLDFVGIQAESYLGIALKDKDGNSIGTLCILDSKPIQETQRLEEILGVFAARAAAELERKAATEALNLLNQDLENQVEERSRALAESEIRFQHIFEQSPIGMGITNIHYQFLQGNPKLCEITGYSVSELVQLTSEEITYPPDYARQSILHQEILENRRSEFSLEKRYIKKNKDLVWVNLTVALVRNLDGNPFYFIFMVKDISDRKRLEEEQSRLITILEASTDYIFMTDAVGNMIWNNAALKELAGLDSDAAVTQRHFADYTPPWAVELFRQQGYPRLSTTGNWLGETALLDAQGQEIPVSQLVLSLKSPQEAREFYASIMRDMRAQKAYEQELQRSNAELARATRLKDEFLANMSHELRTPLNAILGMTEGLKEKVYGDINEQQQGALQTIEQSGNHLLELITDILDLAKIEAGQEELQCTPTSIQQICQSSLGFVRQLTFQKQLQLEVKVQPLLPHLLLDERRIRQVLINLLNNAVKFTPEGGRITLEANLVQIPGNPRVIRIAVSDTGIGISPENLSKLFKSFVQIDSALNRKYEGTGLGLALVKRIIELHGGTVSVISRVGVGSRFTIDIPCEDLDLPLPPKPVSPTRFTPALALPLSTERSPLILLADDNEANTRSIASYLSVKGFRIILATNGLEAVKLSQESLPDLILMDIQMPGMDGLEAIGQIRNQGNLAHIPIIALTALAMTSDRDRCLKAGACEYLTKPIKLNHLVNTIQQILITQDHQPRSSRLS